MRWLWLCVLVLAGTGPRLDTQATDYVDLIEVNTFGDQPRTALIYREPDGTIRDWRWYSETNFPTKLRDGLWLAVWLDGEKMRVVRCRSVWCSRTREDVELTERSRLPEHKRTKLAK